MAFALILYLLFQLGIGVWVSRRIKNTTDYFLAGRGLGLFFASFSIFAVWFGAETCMGAAGAIFEVGLSGGRAEPFGYSLCLILMALFVARQLWAKKLVTLADFFRMRFGTMVETLAVWILIPASLVWAAAQVRAFGQILSVSTPLSVDLAVLLAAGVIVAYTVLGGLLSDVITDVVQGSILCLGLILLLGFSLWQLGGLEVAWSSIEIERFSFRDPDESLLARMDTWMIPIIGSLVAQEVLSRIFACRSASVARNAGFMAAGLYLSVGLIPVFLGLIGPQFSIQHDHYDQFLPLLAAEILPPVVYIIFCGALLSAILSTVDTTLLVVSALVSQNFVKVIWSELSDSKMLLISRLIVVGSGVLALILAYSAESIYDLVELSSSLGAAGVLVITFVGLHSSWGGPRAAIAALVVGMISLPIAEFVLEWEAPFLTSILSAMLAYSLGSLLDRAGSSRVKPTRLKA
ncbi:MAG: sodium:solute symporter [Bradymonadales bacterium]|nr:MAG: sodium:solute symporter [Bradymonadales bacterium]